MWVIQRDVKAIKVGISLPLALLFLGKGDEPDPLAAAALQLNPVLFDPCHQASAEAAQLFTHPFFSGSVPVPATNVAGT